MDDSLFISLADVRDLLTVGEPLPFSVVDTYHRLLLGEGRSLVSERQIEMLIERDGQVERAKATALREARGGKATAASAGATLFDRWEQQVWNFDGLARKLVRREATASQLVALADDTVALVEQDVDIALFICMRQDDRRFALYALTHSLHTCVLVLLTGRQLGWPEARTQSAARAALTMNVSMLELQATMAEQETAPTGRQLEQIREHPTLSAQMLRQAGVQDPDWLAAVEDHHEQAGGGGYPQGSTQVSDIAQLLRAADVFMAKISPRAKRPPIAPQLASRQLFQQQPGAPLAVGLIRAIGVHPPGSLVQLQSGEVAIVTRRPGAGSAAQVATLSNRKGQPVIDTHQRDTGVADFAIRAAFTDTTLFPRVLPERVYGLIRAR